LEPINLFIRLKMLVFNKIKELEGFISLERQKGRTIGFVPTMGALHLGHISLIETSKKQTDITICSIFVNPNQFNNSSDLLHYPRTPENDIKLLDEAGCTILYMPEIKDVYPEKDERVFNFGFLDSILEGAHRPGHFNGVGQVVSILLDGIKPNKAFFGSKDYQQVLVVRSLVKQLGLLTEIIACPILRESDGLAMSSRNVRLNEQERLEAAAIPEMMKLGNQILKLYGIAEAKIYISSVVATIPNMKLEYYEVCDAETLELLTVFNPKQKAVSLIAVFVGNIRLIDNWMVN
jgi:pantoate--beta-alanine ligase